jgi:polyisoprenoid-binding protein YceI
MFASMLPLMLTLGPTLLAPSAHAQDPAAPAEAPAAAPTVTYGLTPKSNALAVLVKFDRSSLMARLGHDHVVTPTTFTGSVTWNMDDVAQCKVDISFPVTALAVDPSGARARAGLEGETDDGDKEKIKENLASKAQLDAAAFSSITFTSTGCSGTGGSATVNGTLTIHGVSKAVSAKMTVTADGSAFSAKGTFTAKHSDFGFTPFSAIAGALKNDELLTFMIDVQGAAK